MRDSRQHHRTSIRRGSGGGFTLVEILIVVVIIGIVAATAVPRLDTSGMRADAAARGVRGAIQVAQRTAVMRQFDVILSIDVANRAVRVVEDRNNNAAVDDGERTTWVRLDEATRFATPPAPVGVAGGDPGAVMLSQPRTIGGLPSIIFRRNGAASSDAEIFLQGATGRGESLRAITVVRATGRAEWYRRDGSWKKVGS